MRKYLEESLHWLHLALFKPLTLLAESRHWTTPELVTLSVGLAASTTLVALGGSRAGYAFDWSEASVLALFFGIAAGVVNGLIVGVAGASFGGQVGAWLVRGLSVVWSSGWPAGWPSGCSAGCLSGWLPSP